LCDLFNQSGEAVGEEHDHGDEQAAHAEEPKLGETLREKTFAGVY
jgi:hypothetical protein